MKPPYALAAQRGLGPFEFSLPREACRSIAGTAFTSFSRAGGPRAEVDAFEELGLQLGFDADDRLELIEVGVPGDVVVAGVALVGRPLDEVIPELEARGVVGVLDDLGADYRDHGFGLFAPNGRVDGVTVYPRGYYG